MKEKAAPAFQIYPKDELAATFKLTNEQAGIYWRLKFACWEHRTLPDDPQKLCGMVGVPAKRFLGLWPEIRPLFDSAGPGEILSPSIESYREWRAKKSAAGEAGGKAKGKQTGSKLLSKTEAESEANHQTNSNPATATASAYKKRKQKEKPCADERRRPLSDFFHELYQRTRGAPLVTNGSDWKQFNAMLDKTRDKFSLETLKDSAMNYLQSDKEFELKQGHPLRFWADNFQGYMRQNGHNPHSQVGSADTHQPAQEKPWLPFRVKTDLDFGGFYGLLRGRMSEGNFDTWIRPAREVEKREPGYLDLELPNEYFKSWWEQNIERILAKNPAENPLESAPA